MWACLLQTQRAASVGRCVLMRMRVVQVHSHSPRSVHRFRWHLQDVYIVSLSIAHAWFNDVHARREGMVAGSPRASSASASPGDGVVQMMQQVVAMQQSCSERGLHATVRVSLLELRGRR